MHNVVWRGGVIDKIRRLPKRFFTRYTTSYDKKLYIFYDISNRIKIPTGKKNKELLVSTTLSNVIIIIELPIRLSKFQRLRFIS